ncbi:flagellar hook-associated protein FlgK [Mesorhizobium sp. M2A.F.Ca.ET.037.01.1.1]|uniref:flagellar hook-associated protein FlgK n=1 Tax=unclassified Mesorhizobium TaxID=325217 RepID=UPI000F75FAEF|nr:MULTISPECIES: flagellar hook-associated protein FlgK [unclassified Mesorhizobium]RUY11534.1 flagellar hook-associated protein FlgK [Mesorhizobium sp. M2A.F.Ca.ET.040.01.1.1]RVC65837.1 flagellar hook-associated protein FlgK [Mesorhizobium sp. M00.F.Ca.ET.038.03.1.1]RVC78519.1 flagellar hook-associated protein FlgK [Mesorhizobium sp. M2A.F.Ca.ET.046.02.1.1]AZO37046.1 flagellar hook-associated protein FlgK [Mesorhizobium sp. M2A.F.Ca.ET.046.03.2.1]RUX19529.1 flagellar hook-associated protein F
MSLSSALSIAQSALLATSKQTSVVSRNVADASNPDYTRRIAVVTSTAPGARMVEIQRTANDLLFRQNLQALSAWSGQSALYDGMDQLDLSVNGVDNASSPSTAIANLQKALQLYATTPSNQNLGTSVVDAAKQVVNSLNSGTKAIQDFRTQADSQIATAVNDLNSLLSQFQDANRAVISGTRSGTDVSDALDQRDALLKKISEYVPVSTFTRGDNDMVITTKDGTTLFETVPRSVTFTPSSGYSAGTPGNTIYIDNVPVSAGTGDNTTADGKLAGLLKLRDGVASTMQSQLDEIARGLITAFAETAPSQPNATGLFTWPGAPAIPPAGTLVDGLAGSISVNAAFDPSAGGNPALLRDGGANGVAYVANTGGGASYADLLIGYGNKLDQPMAFDTSTGIAVSSGVSDYAANAIGWFEGVRQQASTNADNKQALAARTAEALSNDTGVNIDQEMSLLLDLEHTYQASAHMMKTVGDMLDSLLAAVG